MIRVKRRDEDQILADRLIDGRREWVGGEFGTAMRASLAMMRESALVSLSASSDSTEVYRLQGRIAAIDEFLGMDQRVLDALLGDIGGNDEDAGGKVEVSANGAEDDSSGAGQRGKTPDIGDYRAVRRNRH